MGQALTVPTWGYELGSPAPTKELGIASQSVTAMLGKWMIPEACCCQSSQNGKPPDSVRDPALNHKVEIRYRGTYLMSILDLRTHLTCSHGQVLESVRAAFISMFPSNKLTVQMKSSFKYSISNWHKKKNRKHSLSYLIAIYYLNNKAEFQKKICGSYYQILLNIYWMTHTNLTQSVHVIKSEKYR